MFACRCGASPYMCVTMRNRMYVASLTDFVNFAYDAQHRIIPDIGIYYDI
jgi:hypothetical protein